MSKSNPKEHEFVEELEEEVAQYVKKLKNKFKKAQKEAKEYLDGWQRERANFANYKKDVEKRMSEAKDNIKGETLIHMLQVVDNLELMLKHVDDAIKKSKWFSGVEQAHKHAQQTVKNLGLVEIETKPGDKFDPQIHDAIAGEGDIVEEVLKRGYRMDGKVLRPTEVKVRNN